MSGPWRGAPPRDRERLTAGEAGARILDAVQPLAAEGVALDDAFGRVLAEPVSSPLTIPPWDASAMDGYAVRAVDVRGAAPAEPVYLAVDGTVAAGHEDARPLAPGTARRIMTGAPLPPGADAVVRVEDTDGGGGRVAVWREASPARDVRRRGEDVRTGDVVLDGGASLGPAQIGLLAACAAATVHVHRRPRVGILGSGDELVPLARASEAVTRGRIVGSNNHALAAAVREAGGIPVDLGIAADTVDAVRERMAAGAGCDLIVTTAGVSAGEFDCMHDAVAGMGGRAARWAVRMRPGAPMGFGRVGAAPGVTWLGLSGNPGAALVAFELFARPAIRRLGGHRAPFRRVVPVVLGEPLVLAASVLHLLRVELHEGDRDAPDDRHVPRARLAGAQGAGRLTTAARADALLIVPEARARYEAGERLTAIPLGDAPPSATPPPL